jgi:hypothetical protein
MRFRKPVVSNSFGHLGCKLLRPDARPGTRQDLHSAHRPHHRPWKLRCLVDLQRQPDIGGLRVIETLRHDSDHRMRAAIQ